MVHPPFSYNSNHLNRNATRKLFHLHVHGLCGITGPTWRDIILDTTKGAVPSTLHKWEPIQDLPVNWRDLCRPDLHAVHRQWVAERNLIKDPAKIEVFQEKLALLWAIETGVIERLYTVDRGVTVQILEAGLQALGQFHAKGRLSADARALIADQRASLEMVMDIVGGTRNLTAFSIKEMHQRLTLSQETSDAEDQFGKPMKVALLKGDWKKQSNNPRRPDGSIHEYCPPIFVQDEIEQLLTWYEAHTDTCPEVEAAWLHHRFTQIHPFQDGNGRVARALTSAVLLRADHLVLVIRDEEHREVYLDALAAADSGDLKPLVDLFAEIQIADMQEAMKSIRSLRGETLVNVADSIAERVRRRKEASQQHAVGVMSDLLQIASVRLEEAAAELQRALGTDVSARVFTDDEDKLDWWAWQVIEAARKHGYFADLDRPHRWVSLRLGLPSIERTETRLVISLHAVGRAADLHAVSAILTNPLINGEGYDSNRWENEVVSEHPFRFVAETAKLEDVEKEFRVWLERTIENGLSIWGERL